jgi:hypothetical protein
MIGQLGKALVSASGLRETARLGVPGAGRVKWAGAENPADPPLWDAIRKSGQLSHVLRKTMLLLRVEPSKLKSESALARPSHDGHMDFHRLFTVCEAEEGAQVRPPADAALAGHLASTQGHIRDDAFTFFISLERDRKRDAISLVFPGKHKSSSERPSV